MADKKDNLLFSEFPPISTKEWMDKITTDLKGAEFDKKMLWKTREGLTIRPFYRSEDLNNLNYLDSLPGEFPYVRGTKVSNEWYVRQDIEVTDIASANKKALEVLNNGVTSIGFCFTNKELITEKNIEALLKGIVLDAIEINFEATHGNKQLLTALLPIISKSGVDVSKVEGSLGFDPLGNLVLSGKTCTSLENVFNNSKEIVESVADFKKFRVINVNGRHFNNAGATSVQELAFALSQGNEYMTQLTDKGVKAHRVARAMKFTFGVGSNYFMEIAKLRAARLLWARIVEQYQPECASAGKMHMHCETSEWNKTIFDPYVNLLRTQTEAMSATLGGTDSLTVQTFDKIYKNSDAISERIARNQQLLLKEESYFDKIVDPSAGSYFIENLTDSIANEAWKLFVAIEEKGGFVEALKAGFIQGLIKETAAKRKSEVATRREIFLGTNQFPNFTEKMGDKIVIDEKCKTSCADSEQMVEPIQIFRGAQEFESLRLATENSGKRPKVFMLTYGNLAMRLARSQFAGNFFGCAGYALIDNNGFATVEEGVEAALKAGSDIIVLCSSDDEYAEAAPAAFAKIAGKAQFVVAGAPACMDELKAKGIENFINVRSNVLETLKGFNNKLGIK